MHYVKIFSEIPSLDSLISNDIDIPLKATIVATDNPTPDDALTLITVHQQIEELLKSITERECKIVKMRFGVGTSHPHTLQEVAKKLEISRERVRQIQIEALNKLKKAAVKMKKEEE